MNDKLPQGVVGYIFLYMCKSRGTFENTVQTLSYIDVQSNCAKPGEEKSMELHNCVRQSVVSKIMVRNGYTS